MCRRMAPSAAQSSRARMAAMMASCSSTASSAISLPETGAEDVDMDMQPGQRVRDQVVAGALRDQAVEIGIHVGEGIV